MPASVQAATASLIMPQILARAFRQSRTYIVDYNRYQDGSMQSRALSSSSRKSWTIQSRLSAPQLSALRTFYNTVTGGWKEFYFYDVYETSPLFTYDLTATALAGRYIVCFDGPFQQSLDLARNNAQLALVEVS